MKKIRLLFIVLIGALSMQSCGYNTMVEQEEVVAQKWADVQTQYQRRADLIPNLVNTVKGFATQKKKF